MNAIKFTVYGISQTAGSKRTIPLKDRAGNWRKAKNGATLTVTVDDNRKGKDWKQQIAGAALQQFTADLLTGPLWVQFHFYFARPASHYGSGKNADLLKPSAPTNHIQRPDALKLTRCAEDALTGVVWRDDAQICSEMILKAWGSPARMEVTIHYHH